MEVQVLSQKNAYQLTKFSLSMSTVQQVQHGSPFRKQSTPLSPLMVTVPLQVTLDCGCSTGMK